MKNKLADLNNYLFEALEEIMDAETTEEKNNAIQKGRAVALVGTAIVKNANIQLQAYKFNVNDQPQNTSAKMPEILLVSNDSN